MGAHNDEVYRKFAQLDDDTLNELKQKGVI